MRVVMLSNDRKIFEEGSAVRVRMLEYGALADELHIIVFTPGGRAARLGKNVWLHPTNSKSKWYYLWDAYGICKKLLKRWREEKLRYVVTSSDGPTHLLAYLLSIQFKFGWEVQVHTDIGSRYYRKESLKNYLQFWIYRLAVTRASGVRVVAGRMKDFMISKWGIRAGKITVLPIFVDTNRYLNAPASDRLLKMFPEFEHIVLMASRLTREKNISLATVAMGEVRKRYPKTGLVIIGEGPAEENSKFEIRNSKLEQSVKWLPWQDDLAPFYKSADVFLLTSNYEGYGMTLIEAAASGTPIVTTDVGLVGDEVVNAHTVFIAVVGDSSKLAEQIGMLLRDGELRRMMGERLQKAVTSLPDREAHHSAMREYWATCSKVPVGGIPMLVKYVISGGSAAFVDIFSLYVLTEWLGLWYLISAGLAFLVAFWVSFFMQKHWTFQDGSAQSRKQAVVYFGVALVNLGVNTLLMFFLVDLVHLWYVFAQMITGGLIAFSSFFIYRKFIFKKT
ncbi:MAG TPA: glycosyltransferase [Candidatus Paceibacterota bacterium]